MIKKKNPFKKGDIVQYKNQNIRAKFRVYRLLGDHIQLEIVGTDAWFGTHPAAEFEMVVNV